MNARRPLIAGNWKMHKTGTEAVAAATQLKERVATAADVDVMIAPTFTALQPVAQVLAGSNIALGAQNLHWEQKGAFTGEISAPMLVDAGCSHVIVGHSERRHLFGETDAQVSDAGEPQDWFRPGCRPHAGVLYRRNRGAAGRR